MELYQHNDAVNPPPGSTNPTSLQERLKIFHEGNTSIIDRPGLITVITQYILDLYNKGDMGNALILLENLGEAAISDNIEHRERSLITLSTIAEKVLNENKEDLVEAISLMLIRWLKKETEFISGYEIVCLQLSSLVRKMLDLGMWYQAEIVVVALHNLRKKEPQKSKILLQVIAKVQSRIAESAFLQKLIAAYTDENNTKKDVAGTLLIHLGDWSIPFLIKTLALSENKSHRMRLLDLIPAAGEIAVPALVKNLEKGPPWYLARNIILMISKLADPSLYPHIKPFMKHNDIRVQQEVIDCLKMMDSEERTERLLEAIRTCNDKLKPQLVRTLGPSMEQEVGNAFVGLLNNYSVFDNQIRNDIIREVCRFLPHYTTERAIQSLNALLYSTKEDPTLLPETVHEIQITYDALQISLNGRIDHLSLKPLASFEKETLFHTPKLQKEQKEQQEKPKEQPKDGRNWLESAEDNDAIPDHLKKHLRQRKDFYQQLSHDEFLALSEHLQPEEYGEWQKVVCKGDVHSNLYFIEEGCISIYFHEQTGETKIHNLKKGDLFGHDVFMSGSEWDVTLTALEKTEVIVFDQEKLLTLQRNYPHVKDIILSYCRRKDILLKLYESTLQNPQTIADPVTIPFTGNIGDHLANVTLHHLFSYGFSFSFQLPPGIDSSLFMDRELFMRFDERSPEKEAKATVLGTRFFEESHRTLYIMARFCDERSSSSDCTISSISL